MRKNENVRLPALTGGATKNLLLVGRWHGVTHAQRQSLRRSVDECGPGKLIFVITAADQGHTRRHPLTVEERREVCKELAHELERECEIYVVNDIKNSRRWVAHIRKAVRTQSGGTTSIGRGSTVLVSTTSDSARWFEQVGYRCHKPRFEGALPSAMLAAIRSGATWRDIATESTVRLFEKFGIEERVNKLFAEVLLTNDGELSVGRNFVIYSLGMDASMKGKAGDIFPYVIPGLIVDKGCGTGLMGVFLSEAFPDSQIVLVDLSATLLRQAEGQHFPNHNVSVVQANIIPQRFASGTVSTIIYSSDIHEIRSYNGYDTNVVREALRNSHKELKVGGRLIVRDGIKPAPETVWMHCDEETEERFRKFAVDFKRKSDSPGVRFEERVHEGRKYFVLAAHDANEFMSKKDYIENWDIETNEEFGTFELHEWRKELEALGFRVLVCYSYLNEWIRDNRYIGRITLFADGGNRPGAQRSYFDTTAVVVAEKI